MNEGRVVKLWPNWPTRNHPQSRRSKSDLFRACSLSTQTISSKCVFELSYLVTHNWLQSVQSWRNNIGYKIISYKYAIINKYLYKWKLYGSKWYHSHDAVNMGDHLQTVSLRVFLDTENKKRHSSWLDQTWKWQRKRDSLNWMLQTPVKWQKTLKWLFSTKERMHKLLGRGNNRDALVLHGWRLSRRTWNPITSPWMKQSTWFRIVHSGDWCLCLAPCTSSGECQKWMNLAMPSSINECLQPIMQCLCLKWLKTVE